MASATLGYQWFVVAFTGILVGLRCYIRIFQNSCVTWNPRDWFRWNDFFIFAGWTCLLGQVIAEIHIQQFNLYKPVDMPLDRLRAYLKDGGQTLLATEMLYFTCVYTIKAAMLFYYTELVTRTSNLRPIWLSVMIVSGITCTAYLNAIFTALFRCSDGNIASLWEIDDNRLNYCAVSNPDYYLRNSWHALTDILIFAISYPLIRSVALSPQQRIAAYGMFALGLISTIFTIANVIIQSVPWPPNKDTREVASNIAMTEQFTALTVACLPAFKKFVTTLVDKVRHKRRGSDDSWISNDMDTIRKTFNDVETGSMRFERIEMD